ncbi:acyl-CoA dehydrogenase family protein [Enhydrobacter sp.]|jgi:alkylation response protein AidB-like acyl-CoA dehydrogenase|uniref:acyl-CoA dehydrogenase family protein n=1 Tax=Enhydrobacter sp. TaxID=1894999 RepID=UPI0026061B51|nr:acyl-CoA dehydrogenase family protein [Enhydrobacter sp.]WIM11646.1 MAG: Acyl-CoA dehydrogenase [Enhydrobacter sp.]
MRFSFTPEQEEFRASLRRALEARSPTKEVRRLMATEAGFEREGWRRLNQELGLTALAIPEAYGGQGFGFTELGIVLEEMGRGLLCAPYFSTAVLATSAILNGGTEDQKRAFLPPIASGEMTATLAFAEEGGSNEPSAVAMTAAPSGGAYRLDGTKSFVLDGHTADLVVVLARRPGSKGDDGLSLFTVQGATPGLERRALKTMDETRKLARLTFRSVEARLLGPEGAAAAPFATTMQQALICLANEMVGGAERLREDALAYVKMRMQFGRSIASFQTTKNKAADMLVDVELAKSAAYYAAAALDEGDDDLPALASLAKASAAEACLQTAIHAVQMHGGIGFTWDNDTHLWFKRAKSSEILFGDANEHREKMMQHWTH